MTSQFEKDEIVPSSPPPFSPLSIQGRPGQSTLCPRPNGQQKPKPEVLTTPNLRQEAVTNEDVDVRDDMTVGCPKVHTPLLHLTNHRLCLVSKSWLLVTTAN